MDNDAATDSNDFGKHRIHNRVELFATILLAVAAVATAWSSYQSARWSGVQAIDFSDANAARVESTRASTEAGQLSQVDVIMFTQWVDAYAAKDERLASFYFQRFRDEFKPAVKAWAALKPLQDPKAPPTPFAMPVYKLDASRKADRLTTKAEAAGADARESNQRSDNYVLAVVLFAAALFFAGISTKVSSPRHKLWIIGFGYVIFLGTLAWVATFPVTVSV